jgi:Kef-type K+ transport system membrane component KefB
MESHVLLLQIAAILVTARAFAEIAARLGAPAVIGELLAGVLLGPSLLNLIQPTDPLRLLAEIGIILLLFQVGLESDFGKLARAGGRSFILAVAGFILPFLFGFGLCYFTFNLDLIVSLFVAGTLTATSIGVTIRILQDLNRRNSREGQIVLGAAVLDDVLGVVLLALLYELAVTGEVGLGNAGLVLGFVLGFFLMAPLVAKVVVAIIQQVHEHRHAAGIIPALMVSLILTFAALAHLIGAPELLGGFAAGIALSRRFFLPLGVSMRMTPGFGKKIRKHMKPIVQLFTPIFFVMVGLSLDLSAVDWTSPFIWVFSIVIGTAAIVGKIAAGMFVPEQRYLRLVIGMAMVPRAEIGLAFAELARSAGVFSNEIYAAILLVIVYTTLLSPFWIKMYYRFYGARMAGQTDNLKQR